MPHSGRRKADSVVLMALACGATVEAAADKAGVSRATVHRRLKEPEFCQRLQKLRDDLAKRISSLLIGAGGEAVKNLVELMRAPTPPATRLGASRSVLEIGMKEREITDLHERVAALERSQEEK